MMIQSDEIVIIRPGQSQGDPNVITVNCPDKTGLGCDLSRIIFEFGLGVQRGDFSTDGKWCYVIFWVMPRTGSARPIRWAMLKKRLVAACPPSSALFYYRVNPEPKPKQVYLLQVSSADRAGLLNDVSQVLWELELTIHKVKVSTTPDGNAMDLFYITDNRELLHTKNRQDDACDQLKAILGESSTHCEVRLTSPEFGGLECTACCLPPSITEDMFSHEHFKLETDLRSLGANAEPLNRASVTIDNSLSPAHTLLQILCKDQKGLIYDIMRTLKDYNIQVSYGRLSKNVKGNCEVDLFVLQTDGRKILDPQKQSSLCFRLEMEISHPLRVIIVNRGPDTELVVASPIELSGRGRPRVLYDVTLVLKMLDICIFTADIGRNVIGDRQWEVYRFLLIDGHDLSLASSRARNQIIERVRSMLMG
eukprot:Gb_15457 [translate_table: standard]